MSRAFAQALGVALLVCGCGATRVTPDAQGISVEPGPCGRGLLVMESDYQSSNVSALAFDGRVLSSSLASSATEASGFGVALSGDAVLPSSAQPGAQIVLIDRYPTGVLRFLDLASARITAELSVATGFMSNPYDYLALSDHKAYVARYRVNDNPGAQPFDAGGDVLIVDPSIPDITGRIDLSGALSGEASAFSPHPSRIVQADGRVFALLAAYADDFSSGVSSRLVELDTASDSLISTLVLDGLRGCDALALAPDQRELAIGCTGDDLASAHPNLASSGLALVDISGRPRLAKRFAAADLSSTVLGFDLAYAAPNVLFFVSLGYREESGSVGALDTLYRLDTTTALASEVLRSESEPFSLGSVHCETACGSCFAADAQRAGGSVLRFAVDAAGVPDDPTLIRAETRVGLPPRYLGAF